MFNLGVLLAEQGDVEGARAAWQQTIDSGRSGECCLQPNHVPAQLTPAKSPPDRSPSWQRIDLRGGTKPRAARRAVDARLPLQRGGSPARRTSTPRSGG